MKTIFIICILTVMSLQVDSQQETIMTKYTFNSLYFNPAYAGSHGEDIGTATIQYRNQWLGIKGAPVTMLAGGEVSMYNNSIGLGATLGRETIGANSRNELSFNTAYRIQLGRDRFISGGIRTAFFNIRSNFDVLSIRQINDPIYANDFQTLNFFSAGFGVYFHDESMYIGLSVPNMVTLGMSDQTFSKVQHLFLNAGFVIGDEYSPIKWQPSILVKYQSSVPLQVTLSTQAWLNEIFAVGVHYRLADALAFSTEFFIFENWKFTTAYDLTLSDLNDFSNGSPEVMLGYRFMLDGGRRYSIPERWYY